LKAERPRGAVGLQVEVVVVGIDELGIGDARMFVKAERLPGREIAGRELGRRAAGIPVQVTVQRNAVGAARPDVAQEFPSAVVNDVALECERAVRLVSRSHDLRVAAEREDVVPNDIVAAIVLMESAVARAIHEVVLQQDSGTA
jgi:hypothetical protein